MRRLATLVFIYLLATPLIAQSGNATLTGFIQDSSKAFIAGATVVAINTATNENFRGKTGKDGSYNITALPVGPYRMEVEKPAFKTIVREGMFLHVQDTLQVNFEMAVGSTSESVTVDGSGVNINTTDASVSTVVDRKFVENIPLNGRSFQDLISMTPGVITQSPQTTANVGHNGDFSVNGQRAESNYYMVDGVSAATSPGYPTGSSQAATGGTIAASTTLGTTQSLLSVDAMQEFRVQSSTYSAEYGRGPGGQFSILTRSGTTNYHGSAFDYLRNDYFDSNDWFNDHYRKPITELRQNDFGGTFGGPLFPHYSGAHPTFYFFSYEGLRLRSPQAASIQYVPDTALRQNAAPALKPILNAYPLPSVGGIDYGSLAQFIASYSIPGSIDSFSVRVDQTLSSKLTAFVRWSKTPSSTATRQLSSVERIDGNTDGYTAGLTWQVSPSATNELRFGYNKSRAASVATLDTFGGAVPLNLRSAMGLTSTDNAYASFYLYITGVGASDLLELNQQNLNSQQNVVDTISMSLGHHQVKVGGDYRRIVAPLLPASPYVFAEPSTTQSIAAGTAGYISVKKSLPATPVFNELAGYLQDDWRLVPRLSISGGLRSELAPPPTNSDGPNAYTLIGNISNPSQLTLAPQGTSLWQTAHYNFAPRLGLAWQAHTNPGWETVVRAGGGVFFDTDSSIAAGGYSGLRFSASKSYSGSSIPITSAQQNFTISVAPPYNSAPIYAFPSHLQLPYTFQWNGAIEQSFSKHQSITLSYVGSNGRRLLQSRAASLAAANPNFGTVYYFPTGVTSNYQALQIKFQRSVARGLQALASYTWAHSIDYGSNNSAVPLTRGNSDFDIRHNFQAGLSWNIPSSHVGRIIDPIISGWGIDARVMSRTAFPITLNGNNINDPILGTYSSNVNLVPNQPIYLYGSAYPGGRALNKAAFALPAIGSPGDAARNFVRGFGATQANAAVRREFELKRSVALEFRAEAFNVLNHPVFGNVDSYLPSATFGQALKTLAQSLGTMNASYQQGGPRSMQFALKLKF